MPATEHSFGEAPPDRLCVDTNLCVAYLIDEHDHHERAVKFFEHLEVYGSTILYVSTLVSIEFAAASLPRGYLPSCPQRGVDNIGSTSGISWQHVSIIVRRSWVNCRRCLITSAGQKSR